MQRSRKILIGKCVAILSAVPILMMGYASGPDPRKTGGPGDSTCQSGGCHLGGPQQGGGIQVTFSTGTTYTPGQKLTVTLTVTDPSATSRSVYGFQASARPASDTTNGQAGTFSPGNSEFVICEDGRLRPSSGCPSSAPLEFIEQFSPLRSNVITFDWTPPSTDVGAVTFFVAVNAANGNGRADSGDHIYTLGTTGITLTPASSGGGGGNADAPTITQVVNGATFQPGCESGSWVTIKGTNLATSTITWDGPPSAIASDGTLPTSLGGAQVSIGGKAAAIYYASPTQLNVQVPDMGGATGDFPVTVTTSAGTSSAATVTVNNVSPGFFLFTPPNQTPKYIAGLTTDNKFLGPTDLYNPPLAGMRPAKPGETVQLFGTGFGPTNPPVAPGKAFSGAAPLASHNISASIGGVPATVSFAGQVSGAGLYQINLIVPANTPNGDQAVVVTVDGVQTQSGAFIAVQQ